MAEKLDLRFELVPDQRSLNVYLDNIEISSELRTEKTADLASNLAMIGPLRKLLLISFFNNSEGHKAVIVPFTPTAENVAAYIFDNIQDKFQDIYKTGLQLYSIKLWETPSSYALYTKNSNN